MVDLVCYEAEPRNGRGGLALRWEIEMLKVVTKHGACAATLALLTACSSPKSTPSPPAPAALWGEMKPIVSVKELMRDMLDPAADNIFDAVKVESTKSGTVERTPKNDADWEKVRIGAVTVAEGVYLLKDPRPFAPPGDENNSTGPEATELSPAAIKAKLESDPVLWNAKIEALRNVGLKCSRS